jgi:LysM repeat protein
VAAEGGARRRHQRGAWLERNAMGVAALSALAGMIGVGFGLAQLFNRPATELTVGQMVTPSATDGQQVPMATSDPTTATDTPAPPGTATDETTREIQASVRALEPNYTVQPGDTLGSIASRFNTTVSRIQALNNLASANALTVGQKLVIPPPL